jgi:two-component system copper resistance phosphate regulon response regulator CusR
VRLLLVEDERRLAERLARGLREEGFAVDLAPTAATARELFVASDYDAVLLDLGLPDGDGLALLHDWRAEGSAQPVLVLTARDRSEEKVRGLDAGADDYLTKPFDFDELLARVRALLRRVPTPPVSVLRVADLALDRNERVATRGGRRLTLTPKELALLEYLMIHAGSPRSREAIAEHVWDATYEARSNVIDVIVGRLRRKLEVDDERRLLHGVPGVGWVLRAPDGERA